MDKFSCYSKNEGLEKCNTQCGFCESRSINSKKAAKKRKDNRPTQSKIITLRVSNELYNKLENLSKADNRTINNTIETILKNEVDDLNYDFKKAIAFWSKY